VGVTLVRSRGIGTIIDNDPPGLRIDNVTVTEGSTGPTQTRFTVSLSSPTFEEVRVRYTIVEGTAKASRDYLPTSGILIFPVGAVSLPVEVTVLALLPLVSMRHERKNVPVCDQMLQSRFPDFRPGSYEVKAYSLLFRVFQEGQEVGQFLLGNNLIQTRGHHRHVSRFGFHNF